MRHLPHKQSPQVSGPPPSNSRSDWQLPGGETLAEFALRAGIVAPKLLTTAPLTAPCPRQSVTGPALRRAK